MTELDTTPAPDDLPSEAPVTTPEPWEEPTTEPEAAAEPESRALSLMRARRPEPAEPTEEPTGPPMPSPSRTSSRRRRNRSSRHVDAEPRGTDPDPSPRPHAEAEPEAPADIPEPIVDAGPRTVGRYIADQLRAAGVRYAFTVPGESFLGLLDALEGAGIRVVATRHEGAAAFMAEAHGQLTGRPAACLATRAPGGTNLGVGIHTARQDSTPMFVLIGQVSRDVKGFEAFQEIDQVATLGGLAKWSAEPRSADEVAEAMAEASRQALGGRPGPVVLSLPEDLLDEPMPDDVRVDSARAATPRPTDEEIRAVIELLASAERPVILAGAGVLRARTSTELLRFAELLQVPIIAAWRRADVVSNDNPLFLGMAGLRCRVHGQAEARRRRCAARHRVAAQRADDVRLHDAAARAPVGARGPCSGRVGRLTAADASR